MSSVDEHTRLISPRASSSASSGTSPKGIIKKSQLRSIDIKRVHFLVEEQLLGFSMGYDATAIPQVRTFQQIIADRMKVKKLRREDKYLMYENDPDFEELETLTSKITKLNQQLIKDTEVENDGNR